MMYGKELILDIHDCDVSKFNRKDIRRYLIGLCLMIDMKREVLHFWDYENEPEEYEAAPDHLKGISCVQFISTSNITIHSLDVLKKIFVNIFSCKDFNTTIAAEFTAHYFGGVILNQTLLERV